MRGRLRSIADSGRTMVNAGIHLSLVVIVLLMVLPASVMSVPVAFVCLSALVIITVTLVIGLARTGSGFVILGFGTVPLNDFQPIGSLSFLELSDVCFVAGFLLLVPRFAVTALRLPTAFLLGAVGFLTVGTVSAVVSDRPGANFEILFVIVIGVVLVTILLLWWQPGLHAVMAAAAAYMVGNGVNVVASLIEGPIAEGRYAGMTTHPNVMGVSQALGLAIAPFLWGTVRREYRWIVALGAGVSMYGVWISGSRAALVCAVVLTLLYPLFKRSIPAALAVAALCLPGIVLVDRMSRNPDPSNALGRLLGGGSASGSDEARADGAQAGIDQFLSHPLLGDGWLAVWEAHNVYLQVAAAIGIFGLASYVVMLVPVLRPLIAVPPPFAWLAGPGLAAAMIGLVDPALGSRYIWCLAALALHAERLAALRKERSDQVTDPAAQPRL